MKKQQLAIFGGTPIKGDSWVWGSSIGEEEKQALCQVVDAGRLSVFRGGPKVREFEQAFSQYSGARYGVATTSGTTALHTALSALGIGEGDEVLVAPLTFVSSASVILQQNATPVFVDIDPVSYCLSPEDLERKITPRSKAVIPVHIFGHPCDMERISDICKPRGIPIIADAAQAHGALIQGLPLGAFGDCSCYSFFTTKNMTTGEGGMVITNNEDLSKRLRLKREHGSPENPITWYVYDELGYNYAMTEMQAAVGIVQLAKLDGFNNARIHNAAAYAENLRESGLILPVVQEGFTSVFHNYPLLLPRDMTHIRDDFVIAVRAEGVPMDICYPIPLYNTNLFKKEGIIANCPVTDDVASRIMTIFTDPVLSQQDIKDISDAVNKVAEYYLG